MSAPGFQPPSAPQSGSSDFDIQTLLGHLKRFAWLPVVCALVLGSATFFWCLNQEKQYEAKATMEYNPTPTNPLGNEVADLSEPVGNFLASREFYKTQNMVLESRQLAERVVRMLDLHKLPEFGGRKSSGGSKGGEDAAITRAAKLLQGKVSINQVKETRIIEVSVRSRDKKLAALIANTLVDAYLEKTLEDRMSTATQAIAWLRKQEEKNRKKLENTELELHNFKEKANVLSVSMEDRQNVIANEIETYATKLTEARSKRLELEARVSELKHIEASDLSGAIASVVDVHPDVAELRQTHRSKLTELLALKERYGPKHPTRKALEAEVDSLDKELRGAIGALVSSTESELRTARQVEQSMAAQLTRAQSAGMDLNLREIEYERLQRKRANSEKIYGVLLERMTEANLTKLFRVALAKMVDPALVPNAHVFPQTPLFVAAASIMGLLLGIGLALLLGLLDVTLKTSEDIERWHVPVLGVVPLKPIGKNSDGLKLADSLKPGSESKTAGNVDGTRELDLSVFRAPRSSIAEAFRTIRTNLTFMAADSPLRSSVVTSAGPREGKTTAATSLAIAIAQSGRSVLLVDTDMRRPRLHRTFDIPTAVGMSNLLAGTARFEDVMVQTEIDGLSVIPCGPVPPNPAELLHSSRFREFLKNAEERFDRIIFDSPPLGVVTDSAVIAPQVDGALVVVRAKHTRRDAFGSVTRQLRDVNANIVGVVLNQVPTGSGRSAYRRGYYNYYEYGSQPGDDSGVGGAEYRPA